MKNILTICQKEIKSYFVSPIAYALMAIYAIVSGFFSYVAVGYFLDRSIGAMAGRGGPMDVNEWVIRPVIMNVGVISLFLIPMITMRLFAEEKRSGTLELLITSPVRDYEIVVGKWLGALAMYTCILALTAVNLSVLFLFGSPDWRPIATGFAGMLLQGGCLLAVGTFISNTTKNQIMAGAMTFGVSLLMWTFDWFTGFKSDAWAKVLAYLSLTAHFESFSKGVIDSKDVIFYVSVIVLGLFLTTRSLESLRWRG
ncbi:MAG: ABC transporter permease [Acidobacteriaceae bacterium]|jgi:ABC-2 type transport system permease protein|nr:ABC transporter permease [Acidobacteriaceae bacterium]